jgi:NAD(P)H-dependent FMN reductase
MDEAAATMRIALLCGSLRAHSTNRAALEAAAFHAPSGVATVFYEGTASLPHFNPDDDRAPLPASVVELRAVLAAVDAVLISTPEYAGSLPGSFKNALDWTVGGGSFYGKPVGWINPSAMGGARDTYHALQLVLERAGAVIVADACRDIPVPRDALDIEGRITDRSLASDIGTVIAALAEATRSQRTP